MVAEENMWVADQNGNAAAVSEAIPDNGRVGNFRQSARLNISRVLSLLDFVFAFSARNRVFDSLLGFGFFHRSLGFLGALGTGFAALLALFVE